MASPEYAKIKAEKIIDDYVYGRQRKWLDKKFENDIESAARKADIAYAVMVKDKEALTREEVVLVKKGRKELEIVFSQAQLLIHANDKRPLGGD